MTYGRRFNALPPVSSFAWTTTNLSKIDGYINPVLVIEPIVAWRYSPPRMPPGNYPLIPSREDSPKAYCRWFSSHERTSPVLQCTCGYYSLKEPNPEWHAVFMVEIFGNVIEHTKGYRSEFIRVVEWDIETDIEIQYF